MVGELSALMFSRTATSLTFPAKATFHLKAVALDEAEPLGSQTHELRSSIDPLTMRYQDTIGEQPLFYEEPELIPGRAGHVLLYLVWTTLEYEQSRLYGVPH